MTYFTCEDYAIVSFSVIVAILTPYVRFFAFYPVRFTDKLTVNRKFIVNFVSENLNPFAH